MIKFPIIAIFGFLLIATLAWTYSGHRKSALRQQREARYQATLADYAKDLKPGQTRTQVETLLQARSSTTEQVFFDATSWDKFIKLGQEHSNKWYCSHDDIYIRLQFAPSPKGTTASSTDLLAGIDLYHWPRNCL